MAKILPCPKCGEADDIICDTYDTMKYIYAYVQCLSCEHMVKTLGDEEDAIEEWNEEVLRKHNQKLIK